MYEVSAQGAWNGIIRMTMPTFADAEAAIAARDYRAALEHPSEVLDVVGEDARYRRDIQAACADRHCTMLGAECAPC